MARETNSNFGFNVPWWDRLFGTYRDQPAAGHAAMTIGIEQFRDPAELRLDRMLLQPFAGHKRPLPDRPRRQGALIHAANQMARVHLDFDSVAWIKRSEMRYGHGKEEKRYRGRLSDPDDAPELTEEMLDRADFYRDGKLVKHGRGRPRLDAPKKQLTLRLDAVLVEALRASGKGWSGRVNEALIRSLKRGEIAGKVEGTRKARKAARKRA